ncbi:MAG: sel1 repeat family protein [Parachlamydiaceae bacterium]|nr:MAG: sel1 repeat family protein [Parachlamydiaceae bacterium]
MEYYLLSANQGDSGAQFYLGSLYERGEGVSQDLNKAIEYYKLSAALGYEEAQERLKNLNFSI